MTLAVTDPIPLQARKEREGAFFAETWATVLPQMEVAGSSVRLVAGATRAELCGASETQRASFNRCR